jgi:transposase
MEACATSHYWARELTKLGHQVRLMPAKDVKAYVKRNKNDAADAEAICEAVRRPTMRFVQVKSAEQQGRLMQHRTRDLLMRQRTQLINALRAHLAELGIAAAQGREGLKELLTIIASDADVRLPADAHASLIVLAAQLQALQTMIGSIEKRIVAQHRSNEASQRLETIPGIGVVGATTIAAIVTDPKAFRSGRDFSAWIGLVPRQDSTGGKQKLGPISKQGDQYLRRILVVGAHAVLRRARHQPEKYPWLTQSTVAHVPGERPQTAGRRPMIPGCRPPPAAWVSPPRVVTMQTKDQPKRGRPSNYSAEITMAICDRLADGESLRSICAGAGVPDRATVFRWLACHKEFRDLYGWARELQEEELLAEMIEIADDCTGDWVKKIGTDGRTVMVSNRENIKIARLRIYTRWQHVARMTPRKYGRSQR